MNYYLIDIHSHTPNLFIVRGKDDFEASRRVRRSYSYHKRGKGWTSTKLNASDCIMDIAKGYIKKDGIGALQSIYDNITIEECFKPINVFNGITQTEHLMLERV